MEDKSDYCEKSDEHINMKKVLLLFEHGSSAPSDNANKIGRKISPRSSPPIAKGGGVRTPPSKIAPKNGA